MTCKHNIETSVLLTGEVEKCDYSCLINFNSVPRHSAYTHLMAKAKVQDSICYSLLNNVIKFYPSYYAKIKDVYEFKEYEFLDKISNLSSHKNVDELLYNWYCHPQDFGSDSEQCILLRDLYSVGAPSKFICAVESGIDIKMKLSPLLSFSNNMVKVLLLNGKSMEIKLDKIDNMILSELNRRCTYFKLIENVRNKYFDKTLTQINKDRVIDYINKKLYALVSNRVILIH